MFHILLSIKCCPHSKLCPHTMNLIDNFERAASDLPLRFPDTPWSQRSMSSKVPPPVPTKKRTATDKQANKIRKLGEVNCVTFENRLDVLPEL